GNGRENFTAWLAVGAHGEVYVAWLHHDDLITVSGTTTPATGSDGSPRVEKWSINFNSITQGGLWNGKWGDDSQIFPDKNTSLTDPAYPEFSPGVVAPALAADPHHGTLYVAFANANQNPGVLRSTDFGANWWFEELDATATTAAGGYDQKTGTFHIPYVAAADVDPANGLAPVNPANGAFHAAFVTTNG